MLIKNNFHLQLNLFLLYITFYPLSFLSKKNRFFGVKIEKGVSYYFYQLFLEISNFSFLHF